VLEVSLADEVITIGTIADTVDAVLELPPEQIEPAPKIGTRLNTQFLEGIGKHEERFLLLLNVDTIFTAEDVIQAAGHVEEAAGAEEES
jgi:purine-binding chemotaxis protein CheW